MGQTVLIILLVAVLAGGIYLYARIRKSIRLFSRATFGTDHLIEGIRGHEDKLATTPKSVSGMTGICLPQILRDHPGFSLEGSVQKAENQLKAALAAIERQDLGPLAGASEDLRSQVRLRIEEDRRAGIREHFQNIKIHRTEIARYQRPEGCCVITLQSAVEYMYQKEQLAEGASLPGDGQGAGKGRSGLSAGSRKGRRGKGGADKEMRRIQTRYNMELLYVQDAEKLAAGATARVVICPQCGAPITGLGNKQCAYCGSAIEPIDIRVWSFGRIQEV